MYQSIFKPMQYTALSEKSAGHYIFSKGKDASVWTIERVLPFSQWAPQP